MEIKTLHKKNTMITEILVETMRRKEMYILHFEYILYCKVLNKCYQLEHKHRTSTIKLRLSFRHIFSIFCLSLRTTWLYILSLFHAMKCHGHIRVCASSLFSLYFSISPIHSTLKCTNEPFCFANHPKLIIQINN